MIDSHCHLDHEPLFSDLKNVIQRSKDVGIEKLLTISTSLDSFSKIKQLIHKDEIIYGTVGIHPHESDKNVLTSTQLVQNLLENEKALESRISYLKEILIKQIQTHTKTTL